MNANLTLSDGTNATIANCSVIENKGAVVITGQWSGEFPFCNIDDQNAPFRLVVGEIRAHKVWLSKMEGGLFDTFVELRGIRE